MLLSTALHKFMYYANISRTSRTLNIGQWTFRHSYGKPGYS